MLDTTFRAAVLGLCSRGSRSWEEALRQCGLSHLMHLVLLG